MDHQITVNGEEHAFGEGQTVKALLESLGVDTRKVAVELNREILPRSCYDATPLSGGEKRGCARGCRGAIWFPIAGGNGKVQGF